jgi:predicted phage terminase large subunit-like protein
LTFDDLCHKFAAAESIPNDDLYSFLTVVRQDLTNYSSMGPDQIRGTPLGIEVRRRCKADLLWLAGYFLWETNPEGAGNDISLNCIREDTHGVMCRKFAVQKDDTKPLGEQSVVKNRLVLWPRGGQKSTTMTIADTVQWILCFPEIRILFLTAADDLAVSMLDEMKGHFVIKLGAPSLMNLFFPEFSVDESKMGNEFEFTCPVWAAKQVRRREPTVMASSVASTLSGFHFELIKGDDTVSNKNSESEDQCRKVTKNFGINKKMLRPFGYVDLIGTRYSDVDMYGDILEKNVGTITTERGRGWELTTNPDMSQLILIGRAIQIKMEAVEKLEKEGRPVNYREAGEDGCELLMPGVLNYKFLCGEYAKDELAFEGQMNQNPKPAGLITFDRPLLQRCTIPYTEMPQKYVISHVWDFAYGTRKGRDYTTASSVMWDDQSNMFVNDLIRARFKPTELAQAVVAFAAKHKPYIIAIEDSMGSRYLEDQIIREARKTQDDEVIALCTRINWFAVDNQKDAKKSRMGALHPWMVDGRLKFANYLPHLEVLYSEFEKCQVSHHHDDIPDVISHQPKFMPAIKRPERGESVDGGVDRQTFLLQAGWNLLFEENCDAFGNPGRGLSVPILEQLLAPVDEDMRAESYGDMDPILGGGLFG